MNDNKPLILLSNDDGVRAKGLNELIEMLTPLGNVLVMAPDRARSGAACGITANEPLRYRMVSARSDVEVYACNGTPVDCVKLALEKVATRRPDMIVGGINHGNNASVNVHYSGTMGIVLEGCMKGIPSVGFSLCDFDPNADFSLTAPYVYKVARKVLSAGLPSGVCLNVNFPKATAGYAGLKICRMARGSWSSEWYEADHPRGGKYFWLTGKYTNLEPDSEDTDDWALANGFVAVTPVTVDMTAYNAFGGLKDLEM